MPFARRPDWILLSDSTGRRNKAAATGTSVDDALSEFTSEKTSPASVVPPASVTARADSTEVAVSAARIETSTVDPKPATQLTRPHPSKRHRLSESLAGQVRRLRDRAAKAKRVPLWVGRVRNVRLPASTSLVSFGGVTRRVRNVRLLPTRTSFVSFAGVTLRVRNVRLFPTSTTLASFAGVTRRVRNARLLPTSISLVSFAGGTATGVLLMWFASASVPSTVAPSAAQMVTRETTPAPLDLLAPRQDARPANESIRVRSTSQASSVASASIGTSGRRNNGLNQGASSSRSASAPSAGRKGGSLASYRGSLVFRSAPGGARVFVNGSLVGATPLVLENLPVGSRAVRIEADGYQRWSASTQVVANQQTSISATLARAVQ